MKSWAMFFFSSCGFEVLGSMGAIDETNIVEVGTSTMFLLDAMAGCGRKECGCGKAEGTWVPDGQKGLPTNGCTWVPAATEGNGMARRRRQKMAWVSFCLYFGASWLGCF